MKANEISWINTAKGIGIVLVVLGHVLRGLNNAGILSGELFDNTDYIIYSFHMPLFFFLSGIFFIKSFDKRKLKLFVQDKIKHLFYLYILWSLIQYVIQLLMNNYINGEASFWDLFSILTVPRGQMWFLYVLLIIFILAGTIFNYVKKENRKKTVILLIILSLFLRIFVDSNIYLLNKVCIHSLFFFIGMFLYLSNINLKKRLNGWVIATTGFIFSLIIYYNLINGNTNFDHQILSSFFGVSFLCFIAMMNTSERLFVYLGKYSLEIYLAHIIFASGVRILLHKFMDIDSVLLHVLIGSCFGIFIPLLLVKLSERIYVLKFLFKNPFISK